MFKYILMVVIMVDKMKENYLIGFWFLEFGEVYVEFEKVGFMIIVVSFVGGKVLVDVCSFEGEIF